MNQNHYYTNQPNSKSQEKHFSYVLKGDSHSSLLVIMECSRKTRLTLEANC